MLLSEIVQDLFVEKVAGSLKVNITGIAYNSNKVKPGNVFVCISGQKNDGHEYAASAIENGAAAIIVQKEGFDNLGVATVKVDNTRKSLAKMAARYFGFPQRKLKLLGVTGTNGKTTTTYLVKSILESLGKNVGLIGTNQNIVGRSVTPSVHTTPDSLELMELFTQMVEAEIEYVVMEVSSHSLELERVAACEFEVAAFTNLTQDHLDFHGTMENYIAAKAKLFTMAKKSVINRDDGVSQTMIDISTGEVSTYGINNDSSVKAENLQLSANGVEFDVSYKGKIARATLGIPGEFSAYNALAAIGICVAAGFDLEDVVVGLKSAEGVKGRIEVVETGLDFTVIIDYAHTPDGLDNVLRTIRGFANGRVITLFGCGGERDKSKRPQMGKIASELSDFCIVTSDNPRGENPREIIDDIIKGMVEETPEWASDGCQPPARRTQETDLTATGGSYIIIENRFEAIEFALDNANIGDVILLAGKGHETYQVLQDRIIDFDEREIVLKLLAD